MAYQPAEPKWLQALDYNASGLIIYQGVAQPGSSKAAAAWRISRFTYDASDNLTDIEWADGDRSFDNIWDNRASLSYS